MTNATVRVSVPLTSPNDCRFGSYTGRMSADGRFITFASDASDLVVGDTNGLSDIFLRDMMSGLTTRVSVSSSGTQANAESWPTSASVSDDGRYVVFISSATNLVPGDTNGVADIFVHDMISGTTTLVPQTFDGSRPNGVIFSNETAHISGDGLNVLFATYAGNVLAEVYDADALSAAYLTPLP